MLQAPPFLMSFWQLEPFFTPQTLNFLVINAPALNPQQLGDLAISVSPILLGQTDHRQA